MPENLSTKTIIVLSPSDFSLYTLSIIVSLRRAGVQVAGVGLRRLINPSRLLFEGRRDGVRLLKKIWNKLLRRNQIYQNSGKETISQFLKENNIPLERVSAVCKREGIPVRYCYDFNQEDFVDWVRVLNADAVLFTGGGLVRQPLLDATPNGILNCHMGILPGYRGMDLPEWAILNGELEQVGCTVHIMNAGVDTGPILRIYPVALRHGENIRQLRDRIEYLMCSVMVITAIDYVKGRIEAKPQAVADGKQFFVMTPTLIDVVEARLDRLGVRQ